MLQLKIDTAQLGYLSSKLRSFDKRQAAIAITRGLRKTALQGRTEARKGVTAVYNIKVGEVARRIAISASARALQASVEASKKGRDRTPLLSFKARDTKPHGVTFAISKSKERGRIKHGFIASMPGGKSGVFVRQSRSTRKIKEVKTIDVPQMMMAAGVRPAVELKMQSVASRVVLHEIEWQLKKLGI